MSRSSWMELFWFICNARLVLAIVLSASIKPSLCFAYQLGQAEVTENNGIFKIYVSAQINTPATFIRQVLTDYRHIYRLSSSIIESEVLESGGSNETRVRTRLLACASVFCREIERVDSVRTLESGDLQARIVPELSEFRSGQAVWKITAMDDGSELVYQATLEPDFFIPPVVGIPAIRSSLKAEFIATFARIEKIARVNASRDLHEEQTVALVDRGNTRLPCKKPRRPNPQ